MTSNVAERSELLEATDASIVDAMDSAEPMVLRGILYQLTGDEQVINVEVAPVGLGIFERMEVVHDEDKSMIREKAVEFLRNHRDSGGGDVPIGPRERLPKSLELTVGLELDDDAVTLGIQELALDPWTRSLKWKAEPPIGRLADFSVTVIGTGMAGLQAAVQLKRAGIPFTVLEKNDGVGGTWHENKYPGARVDSASRGYNHILGIEFPYPYAFCPSAENKKYFDWIADSYGVRDAIQFNTEVQSLRWVEEDAVWEIAAHGPHGPFVHRSNVVFTAVGFLNRPKIAEFAGAEGFLGESWHTSQWPEDADLTGKRVAVIGTGSTGYQMVPEVAKLAAHVTVFQRTPGWLLPVAGYLDKLPEQRLWLDRNLPYFKNYSRFRAMRSTWVMESIAEIDVNFHDPDACNVQNKRTRDGCIAFMHEKLGDPDLVARLTPGHPVLASRPIVVDPNYSFLDAIQRDDVTLHSGGIKEITASGIVAEDGGQYDVDVIIYATGFHATEYLYPMEITGRDGMTIEQLWKTTGAQAYLGTMLPGFPNMFTLYGPNTNGGMPPAAIGEMGTLLALRCIEKIVTEDKKSVTVTPAAYERWNTMLDARNQRKVWSDSRAHNYYWTDYGRSATMNPLYPSEMWSAFERPDYSEFDFC